MRLELRENFYKRSQPLADTVRGEIVLVRAGHLVPFMLEGPPVTEIGCAFVAEEVFAGVLANPAWSSPAHAERCLETIAYWDERDSVHVDLNPRLIDAGTSLTGFLRGDTIRGNWYAGSESLDQGGRGVFVMWRLTEPAHPHAAGLVRHLRSAFRAEPVLERAWSVFDPPHSVARRVRALWLALLGAGALAAILAGAGSWRRRTLRMAIWTGAFVAEWVLYSAGGNAMRRVQYVPDLAAPWPLLIAIWIAILLVVPAATVLLLRATRDRSTVRRVS